MAPNPSVIMRRSFSETKFLCYKACVGAGIDVGRAEDIASSAVRIGAYQSEVFDFLRNLRLNMLQMSPRFCQFFVNFQFCVSEIRSAKFWKARQSTLTGAFSAVPAENSDQCSVYRAQLDEISLIVHSKSEILSFSSYVSRENQPLSVSSVASRRDSFIDTDRISSIS